MLTRARTWSEWMPWLYSLLFVPLVLLLIETIRGASREIQMLSTQTMQTELQLLRSLAERHAVAIDALQDSAARRQQTPPRTSDDGDVRRYWSQMKLEQPQYLYLAVVDRDGRVLLHTDAGREGQHLGRGWYDRRLTGHGSDLTWSEKNALAGGRAAYDVSIDLRGDPNDGPRLHAGLDSAWLAERIEGRKRTAAAHWAGVIAVMGAVDLAAGWALVSMIRHHSRLKKALTGQARKRAKEIAQLGSGLAHEIRNPLHAVRINLHTLRRAISGKTLPPDQLAATIDESDAAIERLDVLMRDLLMFADPAQGQATKVDLVQELQATLRLLAEDLKRERIAVREALPEEPAPIVIDPTRLRQSLLNLLTFAQYRSGKSGTIEVAIARDGDGVELSVVDSGPAVPAEKQRRMFEPFEATAETGSGLGLALVQTYVEEAGGKVRCSGSGNAKNQCQVWFPLAEPAKGGTL